MKSLYLAVEGRNGSGKSTLCNMLWPEFVKRFGPEQVLQVREPDFDHAAGEEIRDIMSGKLNYGTMTTALLYAANRSNLVNATVRPFLRKPDRVVLSDRCFLSQLVYQSEGVGLTYDTLMGFNPMLLPELILIIDASTAKVQERMHFRDKSQADVFEKTFAGEGIRYISAGRYAVSNAPCEVRFINGNNPINYVYYDAIREIREFIRDRGKPQNDITRPERW